MHPASALTRQAASTPVQLHLLSVLGAGGEARRGGNEQGREGVAHAGGGTQQWLPPPDLIPHLWLRGAAPHGAAQVTTRKIACSDCSPVIRVRVSWVKLWWLLWIPRDTVLAISTRLGINAAEFLQKGFIGGRDL